MPSDQSTWLISVPQDGDSDGVHQELENRFQQQSRAFDRKNFTQLSLPAFKTGTLDGLISLSEDLVKQDAFFTQTTAKIVETIRNLLNNDPSKMSQHTLVNDRSVDEYLLGGWRWNEGRYAVHRGLRDIVETLNREMSSIDNVMKAKLNNYNLAKGTLVQIQRKKHGNLSVRSVADIVPRDIFVRDSEYLETLLVAVPKNSVKDWKLKYERLASMVVPRSSTQISSDDDYTLFSVVVFKRVHDEFAQKCRENKFILREFTFSEDAVEKQREELRATETSERELWAELLRLARTNFSEAYQILVHLKIVSLFVESVLRYGLPAEYVVLVLKPDPKHAKKALSLLISHFSYLSSRTQGIIKSTSKSGGEEEFAGEWQAVMEQEMFDFVLFEIPWIVN
ncbi:ATPase V1 complex subunit C [Gautieria morchelliformis]|nr:ATPase V1 complex subunit C [Gautieria morchelliformis]